MKWLKLLFLKKADCNYNYYISDNLIINAISNASMAMARHNMFKRLARPEVAKRLQTGLSPLQCQQSTGYACGQGRSIVFVALSSCLAVLNVYTRTHLYQTVCDNYSMI